MDAYDVALHIRRTRGWKCRPQGMGIDQARLMVEHEQRWVGITTVSGGVVLLAAGAILPEGGPTSALVETSATVGDPAGLVGEVEFLWQRLVEVQK
ncbi:hypothetical protein ACFYXM_11145 [Streptomyces sp. NPDC002476]|uniref:hypothetical protein n=1 Tax=Streptomyces sp. NPDC002476 TaxID=3364648 RepID=UPI0036752E7C